MSRMEYQGFHSGGMGRLSLASIVCVLMGIIIGAGAHLWLGLNFSNAGEVSNAGEGKELIAYITNSWTNELLVVDLASKVVKNRIPTGGPLHKGPCGIDITPDGGRIYVTNPELDNVLVVNTTNHRIEANTSVGRRPIDIVISRDGRFAWVLCSDSHEVYIIQTESNRIVNIISVDAAPHCAAISPDGSWLYVGTSRFWYQGSMYCASGKILVINASANTVMEIIDLGSGTWVSNVVFTPDSRYA